MAASIYGFFNPGKSRSVELPDNGQEDKGVHQQLKTAKVDLTTQAILYSTKGYIFS